MKNRRNPYLRKVKEGRFIAEGPPAALSAASPRYRVTGHPSAGGLAPRGGSAPPAGVPHLPRAAPALGEPLRALSAPRPPREETYLDLTADDVREQAAADG